MNRLAHLRAPLVVVPVAILLIMPTTWLGYLSVPAWLLAEDKLAHAGIVAGLTIACLVWTRRPRRIVRMGFAMFLLATYLEAVQTVVPWRVFELADITANAVGAVLGIAIACTIIKLFTGGATHPRKARSRSTQTQSA